MAPPNPNRVGQEVISGASDCRHAGTGCLKFWSGRRLAARLRRPLSQHPLQCPPMHAKL